MDDFKKRTLLNIGAILGSFLLFGLVLFWLAQNVTKKSDEIVAARKLIDERSYALENLAKLKSREPLAMEYQKKMAALLPSQDGLFSFPQYLEETGRIHGLSVNFSFASDPKQPTATEPGEIGFSFIFKGSADNIRRLVDEMEFKTTKFMTTIDSLNLVSEGDAYRAEGKGRVYFK